MPNDKRPTMRAGQVMDIWLPDDRDIPKDAHAISDWVGTPMMYTRPARNNNPSADHEEREWEYFESLSDAEIRDEMQREIDAGAAIERMLLEALTEYVAEWDAAHSNEDHRTGYTPEPESLRMARAAIAKALGDQASSTGKD